MSEFLEQVKQLSPDEKKQLAKILADATKEPEPKREVMQLGEPMGDPRRIGKGGRLLSDEEVYDRENPIVLWTFGYSTCEIVMGRAPTSRKYTNDEVNKHNHEVIQHWLEEKRKYFPNCEAPFYDDVAGYIVKKR